MRHFFDCFTAWYGMLIKFRGRIDCFWLQCKCNASACVPLEHSQALNADGYRKLNCMPALCLQSVCRVCNSANLNRPKNSVHTDLLTYSEWQTSHNYDIQHTWIIWIKYDELDVTSTSSSLLWAQNRLSVHTIGVPNTFIQSKRGCERIPPRNSIPRSVRPQ